MLLNSSVPKLLVAILIPVLVQGTPPLLVYEGTKGPGKGRHIVLVAADQEYRSEEAIPMLARILAERHGFKCTVLFAINPETGGVDPTVTDNIPGLETLRVADLAVLFLRFLELPDEQMKEIIDYTNSGRPLVGLRTSTHPFNYRKRPDSPYAKFHWKSKAPEGGYGRLVFGETWVSHYGVHQKESTRGLPAPGMEKHPILKGVTDIFGESDVYEITALPGDSTPVVLGQVLMGMEPNSPPNPEKKLTPIAWTKSYTGESGKKARVFTTTMGHANDFANEGFRRMVLNACYWALGMEDRIPSKSNVEPVGEYKPNPIGIGKQKQGLRLTDFKQ
jgi:hypothetical protein